MSTYIKLEALGFSCTLKLPRTLYTDAIIITLGCWLDTRIFKNSSGILLCGKDWELRYQAILNHGRNDFGQHWRIWHRAGGPVNSDSASSQIRKQFWLPLGLADISWTWRGSSMRKVYVSSRKEANRLNILKHSMTVPNMCDLGPHMHLPWCSGVYELASGCPPYCSGCNLIFLYLSPC